VRRPQPRIAFDDGGPGSAQSRPEQVRPPGRGVLIPELVQVDVARVVTTYGLSLAMKSDTTLEMSLIIMSAWFEARVQVRLGGRDHAGARPFGGAPEPLVRTLIPGERVDLRWAARFASGLAATSSSTIWACALRTVSDRRPVNGWGL
jgi:hypothetical protein